MKYRGAHDPEILAQELPSSQRPTTAILEVIEEKDLSDIFSRSKSVRFLNVELVQTVVKDEKGIGKMEKHKRNCSCCL